ncbi:MAG TPA: radical SAM protein [Acidobacteriota bacterium]
MSTTADDRRGGRRVALLACYPLRDAAMPPQFISNHGMRMVEASLRASGLEGLELKAWDLLHMSLDSLLAELLDFDPDVVGFSTYLWSFPFFVEVARRLKADDRRRTVVFGGPSARPSMLSLEPFAGAREWIDALAINEGEDTFVAIVEQRDRSRAALANVAGLALPAAGGWTETRPRALSDLNQLPSPYQLGLVPAGGIGVLQTYRGCPFTCSFCEWGTLESPKRAWNVDALVDELDAMARNGVSGTLLVDAGLNLNHHAFRNLRMAAEQSGFYRDRYLICEIYPAKVTDEHIAFLESIGRPLVGMGLQSFDHDVLSHVERTYDEARFARTLEEIMSVATVAVEIILGLPGDNPATFRKTFERARSLPVALRVYHCVVLPSALMVRAPKSDRLDFDPVSLKMRSCLGWSRQELQKEVDFVTERAERERGDTGDYFWVFSAPNPTQRVF